MKTAFVIAAAVVVTIGIAVYQFAFEKIRVEPGSLSRDEMIKTCDGLRQGDTKLTLAQNEQMKTACECMMDASAAALKNKDGVTVIDWMTQTQQQTTACMAKAGISTQ